MVDVMPPTPVCASEKNSEPSPFPDLPNFALGTVCIVVDKREPSAVFQNISSDAAAGNRPVFTCHSAVLPIGDYAIYDQNGKPAVLIERKTWGDLGSSFKDRRSGDQGIRMMAGCKVADVRPIYLIESQQVCEWEKKPKGISNKLLDCCVNRYVLDGIGVIRTANVSHTINVLQWLAKRVSEGKLSGFGSAEISVKGSLNEIKFKKGDNLTTDRVYKNMLQCVHGMSRDKADAVASKFPTMRSLAAAYAGVPNTSHKRKRGELLVSDLKLSGIGPQLSKRIFALFE